MNFLNHGLRIGVLMGEGEIEGGPNKRRQRGEETTEQENAGLREHPWGRNNGGWVFNCLCKRSSRDIFLLNVLLNVVALYNKARFYIQ